MARHIILCYVNSLYLAHPRGNDRLLNRLFKHPLFFGKRNTACLRSDKLYRRDSRRCDSLRLPNRSSLMLHVLFVILHVREPHSSGRVAACLSHRHHRYHLGLLGIIHLLCIPLSTRSAMSARRLSNSDKRLVDKASVGDGS
jgi:hypothetical protein